MVLLLVAALLVVVFSPRGRNVLPGAVLTSNTDFGLSGTLSYLTPGVSNTLTVTATNPYNVPISATQLTVQVTSGGTVNCPVSYLSVNGVAFVGSTSSTNTVTIDSSSSPPLATSSPSPIPASSSGTIAVPIEAASTAPDACESATFNFGFTGSAMYTATTETVLTNTPSTSTVGQTVALQATVSGTVSPSPTPSIPPPSASGDYVTFYDCTPAPCTPSTSLGTGTYSAGVANLNTSFGSVGTYDLDAVFTPAGSDVGSYSASTSTPVNLQTVTAPSSCVTITTTGATPIPSQKANYTVPAGDRQYLAAGSTISGNVTVDGTFWLDGGTVDGNVTVASGGSLLANGGTVKGNITSTSGPVSLQGTTVAGNVQATGASLAIGAGTTVSGNVQATGGAALCMSGTSAGSVKISGNLQVTSLTGTSTVSICNTAVSGNLIYTSNSNPLVLGGSASCLADTVSGNLQITSNSGKLAIGGSSYGNSAKGNIQVSSNTGGGTLFYNSAGGNCQLQGDKPGVVGTGNTAKGSNSCNTGAGGA